MYSPVSKLLTGRDFMDGNWILVFQCSYRKPVGHYMVRTWSITGLYKAIAIYLCVDVY